tara:strand:+ start:4547 stop:4678 length:132 start_codon:yes stop_codon:yes gene_type:complete
MQLTDQEKQVIDDKMSQLITQNRQIRQEFHTQFINQVLKERNK